MAEGMMKVTKPADLSHLNKDQIILKKVQQQGRRRALTENELDAVLTVRLSRSTSTLHKIQVLIYLLMKQ